MTAPGACRGHAAGTGRCSKSYVDWRHGLQASTRLELMKAAGYELKADVGYGH